MSPDLAESARLEQQRLEICLGCNSEDGLTDLQGALDLAALDGRADTSGGSPQSDHSSAPRTIIPSIP